MEEGSVVADLARKLGVIPSQFDKFLLMNFSSGLDRTGLWPKINFFCNITVSQLWVMVADTVEKHMEDLINNPIKVNHFLFIQICFLHVFWDCFVNSLNLSLHLEM